MSTKPPTTAPAALDASLAAFFRGAVRINLTSPKQAAFFLRTAGRQLKTAGLRSRWRARALEVPPLLIFSVTERCNLRCAGCYARALHQAPERELESVEVKRILNEAEEPGMSFIVLAGGEPLVRGGILKTTARSPKLVFLVFTNGLLIHQEMVRHQEQQRNVIPVSSVEGDALTPDARRGPDVFARMQAARQALCRSGVLFGLSMILTRQDLEEATSEAASPRSS